MLVEAREELMRDLRRAMLMEEWAPDAVRRRAVV